MLIALTALTLLSNQANADPSIMVGVGYTFGEGGPALTLKALSSDKKDEAVAAAGVSFYPLNQNKFGLDLGVGFHADDAAVILSWDFLQKAAQVSAGWADTKKSNAPAAPPPPPPPL